MRLNINYAKLLGVISILVVAMLFGVACGGGGQATKTTLNATHTITGKVYYDFDQDGNYDPPTEYGRQYITVTFFQFGPEQKMYSDDTGQEGDFFITVPHGVSGRLQPPLYPTDWDTYMPANYGIYLISEDLYDKNFGGH